MVQTVSDFLVQRLFDWGVRIIFGYPGDGINGVFGSLNRSGEKINFVPARLSEMAASGSRARSACSAPSPART